MPRESIVYEMALQQIMVQCTTTNSGQILGHVAVIQG